MPIQSVIPHDHRGELVCSICGEPMNLQSAKWGEDGNAVHEECYVHKMLDQKPPAGRAA